MVIPLLEGCTGSINNYHFFVISHRISIKVLGEKLEAGQREVFDKGATTLLSTLASEHSSELKGSAPEHQKRLQIGIKFVTKNSESRHPYSNGDANATELKGLNPIEKHRKNNKITAII